ncbi:MAG: tRNA (guanosine(46)-N7)-methyltransferase TrmB [Sphaerochaetaceae bacterium]|nr:tRNA (guanosine(46)-N7)-methyltransferase TrmB [Sphaerochaetaceae bacterium]
MSEIIENEELTTEEQNILDLIPSLRYVEKRSDNGWREIKSFVLRGQRLKDFQIQALKEHFYDYAVEFKDQSLDFKKLFGNDNPVVIEIGFGMGDSTLKIAKANPNINYLGIEVFLYGFSKLLANIAKEGLNNIKVMRFDAVQVLQNIVCDNSVDGFHVFFPDPWPKKRHHKKRLIQLPFTTLMASKLKKGGYIYCVTDWEDYAKQMLEVLNSTPGMVNPYNGYATPRPWRPETGFERKGLEKDYIINEVWVEKN